MHQRVLIYCDYFADSPLPALLKCDGIIAAGYFNQNKSTQTCHATHHHSHLTQQ